MARCRVTEIGLKASPPGHAFISSFDYSHTIMRGAFVVQLGPETKPAECRFEGWVQEVDSCTELRFRSSEELLKFLGARFDLVLASANKGRADNKSEQVPCRKKGSRKERGLQ
jgi:hypothetical protein